jgi:hypothetical protein
LERRTIYRGCKLDPETDGLLADLARAYEGNLSLAMRSAIRQAAGSTAGPRAVVERRVVLGDHKGGEVGDES